MQLNWDNARAWRDNANIGKDDYGEPRWDFDCGFKLDFDGSLVRITSRFYPPTMNNGNWWEGNVKIFVLGKEVIKKELKCNTLDELKLVAEKFVNSLMINIEQVK